MTLLFSPLVLLLNPMKHVNQLLEPNEFNQKRMPIYFEWSCVIRDLKKDAASRCQHLPLLKVKVTLYPTLCDPMDYTVHGILQARIVEWVAVPFSRGSSQFRDRT